MSRKEREAEIERQEKAAERAECAEILARIERQEEAHRQWVSAPLKPTFTAADNRELARLVQLAISRIAAPGCGNGGNSYLT